MTNKTRAQAIVIQNGRVLFGYGKGVHYFIGGGAEEGETPESAVLRELREEANLAGTVLFRIDEPDIEIHHGPGSYYDGHVTFLVDVGEQSPRLGFDPEETERPLEDRGLAGMEMVPLDQPTWFTWIDIRYLAALRSECNRREETFPWLDAVDGLLSLWRVSR